MMQETEFTGDVGQAVIGNVKQESQLTNEVHFKGKKVQVFQGTNHGTISTGKIINKVVRKKKAATER